MEILITAIVTIAAAWLAFYLAKARDDKLRVVEIATDYFAGDFAARRADALARIRDLPDEDVRRTACKDDPANPELRQSLLDVLNRHELNCYLYNRGALDHDIFTRYLRDTITDDHRKLDRFLACIEDDFRERGVADERPFFPEIRRMTASGRHRIGLL